MINGWLQKYTLPLYVNDFQNSISNTNIPGFLNIDSLFLKIIVWKILYLENNEFIIYIFVTNVQHAEIMCSQILLICI